MLRLTIGIVLLAGGIIRLGLLAGDAFMASVDSDPRLPGWAAKPSLMALAATVAGVLILIS